MQSGALGILGALAFYGLKWGIPAIVNQQKAVAASMADMAAQSAVNTRVLADLTAMLIQHDATVRGQNPDVMGTTQELVARILSEANRPQRSGESSHGG